ncbi:FCD domain-containing protein [Streptacidiphilus sp. MAP12-20]|uniref:FCD domain-containing protein n=1 Tax=Streptacidiphilus sp. MAP12-20 TaxID=3156299 RepID=UPI00351827A6
MYPLHFRDDQAVGTCREHERILDALTEKDPDTAESAVRSHIQRSRERLIVASDASAPTDRPSQR